MNHPDPDTLIALALDTLPEEERRALLAHVRRCPVCGERYREHLEALSRLVPPLAVPSGWEEDLKARLRQAPTPKPPVLTRRRLLAGALALALGLYLGQRGYRSYQEALAWRRFLRLAGRPGARLMPLVDLSGTQTGWALRTPEGEVLLYLQTPPPPGRVYQAWLLLDGERKSLGLSATRLLELGPLPPESQVGVSVEPPGGSPSPTTPPVGRARI
ncbi:hypothetical protein TthAA37_16850 [Thermus thermophilus]|uniref:Anti-sigma K factor RskA C-terminal domain-containing protein n=1 Tax=Thermus thermophilus TaxID=274 RepID=A0AAD1NYN7_THETH|nr:anti-sigma factor [Thermus thermophilus]BBL82813.1 hypothetical protein TthAA220_15970 [Thermus thermophilus]BBL85112.1 hypothetical protein TthAA229_15930 [Thermus thermophilus]BCZ87474.1 hypothetical protein TthAA11_16560 [Thermus thermophilus]BCZ89831.1 hypothetical protein TthAA22_16360 [Thermus thermophilus]BCZ92496.1 hypothetical protein TthAA37_16850 [Thermus thermophilus]